MDLGMGRRGRGWGQEEGRVGGGGGLGGLGSKRYLVVLKLGERDVFRSSRVGSAGVVDAWWVISLVCLFSLPALCQVMFGLFFFSFFLSFFLSFFS